MLSALRQEFNARFTPEKYRELLRRLDERSGTHVKFRICETPCFFPADLIRIMQQAGAELAGQLVGNAAYLAAARAQIPPEFLTPNESSRPMFLQVDFGLIRDDAGRIAPRLVEIQAFPSLYAFQPVLQQTYRDVYELDVPLSPNHSGLFERAVLGDHAPENVVLLEIDPTSQKTRPDFLLTERLCGIRVVDIREVRKRGDKLYFNGVPIDRIYNRTIADELQRSGVQPDFRFSDDLDVEWAGHPNWFFLISKFSLPYLRHETVPESWFLDELGELPLDLDNYVLKPLYSFAGLGVKVGPSPADVTSIPEDQRHQYLLQRRMKFEPVIDTPFGPTQAEIRVMYIWLEELTPVSLIIRMGRGKMMGVDHNRDMEWVGASAAFVPGD